MVSVWISPNFMLSSFCYNVLHCPVSLTTPHAPTFSRFQSTQKLDDGTGLSGFLLQADRDRVLRLYNQRRDHFSQKCLLLIFNSGIANPETSGQIILRHLNILAIVDVMIGIQMPPVDRERIHLTAAVGKRMRRGA